MQLKEGISKPLYLRLHLVELHLNSVDMKRLPLIVLKTISQMFNYLGAVIARFLKSRVELRHIDVFSRAVVSSQILEGLAEMRVELRNRNFGSRLLKKTR